MNSSFYKLPKDLLKTDKLSITEKLLLSILLDAWERRKHRPFQYPQESLSKTIGTSRKTIGRAIGKFIEMGIVWETYRKRENGQPGKCSLYSINESALDFVLGKSESLSTEDLSPEDKILQCFIDNPPDENEKKDGKAYILRISKCCGEDRDLVYNVGLENKLFKAKTK